MLFHTAESLYLAAESIDPDLCGSKVGAVAVALDAKCVCLSFLFSEDLGIFRKLCIVFCNSALAILAFCLVGGGKLLALVYILSCGFITALVLFIGASEKFKTGMDIGNFLFCRRKLFESKSDSAVI